MVGQTKEAKLCCTANTFVVGAKKTLYCEDCFSEAIEEALSSLIDWDQVAHWFKDAVQAFIYDNQHCESASELMSREHEEELEEPFEKALTRILGPDWSDHDDKYETAIEVAYDIKDDFLRNAEGRIKIVVE
jgi:hypothetical protein